MKSQDPKEKGEGDGATLRVGSTEVNIDGPPKRPIILHIPLDQILRDLNQIRKKFKPEKILELAYSIRDQGLQQLPKVNFAYKDPKTGLTYFYMDKGERRLRAHLFLRDHSKSGPDPLQYDRMPCHVGTTAYDGTRDVLRRLQQGAENECREPQSHSELIEMVEDVVAFEIARKDAPQHGAIERALVRVSEAFGGRPISWVRNYHTLSGLSQELRNLLDEGSDRLSFQSALSLARAPRANQLSILADSEKHVEQHGLKARRSFISKAARTVRQESGEKIRGRAADDKRAFMGLSGRVLLAAAAIRDFRGDDELRKFFKQKASQLTVEEVEAMLNEMKRAAATFSLLQSSLQDRRDMYYGGAGGALRQQRNGR